MKGRQVRFILTWLTTLLILGALFWKIRPGAVARALSAVDLKFLLAALLLSAFNYLLVGAERCRRILRVLGCRISLSEAVLIRMGGAPIKGLLPAKSGELARIAYLKRCHDLPYSSGILSVLLGLLLSLLSCSAFILAGWILVVEVPAVRIVTLLFLVLLLPLVILALTRGGLRRTFSGALDRMRFGAASKFRNLLSVLKGDFRQEAAPIVLYSILLEGCKIANVFILFRALDIHIPFSIALFQIPLTVLAASLPITVGGLGTRETSTLILFSAYAPSADLVAASLSISLVNLFFPMILGLFFIRRFLDLLLADEKERIS